MDSANEHAGLSEPVMTSVCAGMRKRPEKGKPLMGPNKKAVVEQHADGFTPCSPDMTICGDCDDNRTKKKCPRLREWLEKRNTEI